VEISIPVNNMGLDRKHGTRMPELVAQMMAELATWPPKSASCSARTVPAPPSPQPWPSKTLRRHLEGALGCSALRPATADDRQAWSVEEEGQAPPGAAEARRQSESLAGSRAHLRDEKKARLVRTNEVLWYRVCPEALVRLVVVRDPEGIEQDDYLFLFFTTDLEMAPDEVKIYADRWSIEVCYRQVKQDFGGQWPQSWKDKGPERAAGLSFLLYEAISIWYITVSGDRQRFSATPRYPEKRLLRRRPRRARSGAMARANICQGIFI